MAGPVSASGPRLGRVASFDAARGLGSVVDDVGSGYDFHATAIADGSRRIDIGAVVSFTLVPGHRGVFEARSLTKIAESSAAASR